MKAGNFRRAAPALFAAVLLWSCAQLPETGEEAAPKAGAGVKESAIPPPAEDRLSEPIFGGLPVEARRYLERLSRAFSDQDEAFLLAQGELQFEAEVRPRHDKETYLALLYRIGPYALDSPRQSTRPPRLAPADISRIQYLSWEEAGPLLEIKAQLIGTDGSATPCLIILVWRLREPKIEGLFR